MSARRWSAARAAKAWRTHEHEACMAAPDGISDADCERIAREHLARAHAAGERSAHDLIRRLVRIATGETQHRYTSGRCPDAIEGRDVRDPLCAACKVLVEAARLLGTAPRKSTKSRRGKSNLVRLTSETAKRAAEESRAIFDLIPGRYVIAGGWVRDRFETPPRKSKDVDLFFATNEDCNAAEVLLLEKGAEYEDEGSRNREVMALDGVRYDLVNARGMTSVAAVLNGFDLTCCSAAVTRDGAVWAHPDFAAHVAEKRIEVIRTPKPAGTKVRIAKLKDRGYTVGASAALLAAAEGGAGDEKEGKS